MKHLESLGTSRLAGVAYTQLGMQEHGWRQAAMDGLALMGVTPPLPGASLDVGAAISTLTATAQTAVLTPAQPASHMDLVYYSHKSSFCMEPYLLSVSNQNPPLLDFALDSTGFRPGGGDLAPTRLHMISASARIVPTLLRMQSRLWILSTTFCSPAPSMQISDSSPSLQPLPSLRSLPCLIF